MKDVAIGYGRKSSEGEDRQINSVEDQLTEIKRLEVKHGIPIPEGYLLPENKSAKIADQRPQFNKMIKLIESGRANTIYVAVINRLARNGKEAGILINLLDTGKLKQIITPSAIYTSETNSEMLWIEFMGSAKFSKDLSKIVTERGILKAERGEYSGVAPLGYRNTPLRPKGQRIILQDKNRWELMRQWFELMLTGTHTVETSLAVMVKRGLRTRKGKIPSRSAAYALMRNIVYTGQFYRKGILYPGTHKPMVSISEWLKIQHILDSKGKKGGTTLIAPDEKTFQGMLKCGECGAAVTTSKATRHYKNGTTQVFWYAHCTKRLGTCSQQHLPLEAFNNQLIAYVKSLELDPQYAEWIKAVIKRRNAQEFARERAYQSVRTKKLVEITDRKEKLYGMKTDGLYSDEEYQHKKNELLKEEQELRESFTQPTTAHWESIIDDTINFATSLTNLFESGDIFTRQMVLRILGLNFKLLDKKVVIQAKDAFLFLKGVESEVYKNNLMLEPKTDSVLDQIKISGKTVQSCAEERT